MDNEYEIDYYVCECGFAAWLWFGARTGEPTLECEHFARPGETHEHSDDVPRCEYGSTLKLVALPDELREIFDRQNDEGRALDPWGG